MWSISLYTGDSPFSLEPIHAHPVLTKNDVADIPAEFVADPFMLKSDNKWYMFFEAMNIETARGEIGLATSDDALTWTYERVVLKESFHLSYPYIFTSQDEHYMIPETLGADAVCLYKAEDFPYRWSMIARLLPGSFADPSLIRFNDLWWLFVCSTPYRHDTLRLYFATELVGPWTEHPKSPIIRGDKCRARPAGRMIELNNSVIRFAQDCVPQYGNSVRAFQISELTPHTYAETEHDRSPLLSASGNGWNALGMHHVDAHQVDANKWLACVDGLGN